jgi:hypothetical protein
MNWAMFLTYNPSLITSLFEKTYYLSLPLEIIVVKEMEKMLLGVNREKSV